MHFYQDCFKIRKYQEDVVQSEKSSKSISIIAQLLVCLHHHYITLTVGGTGEIEENIFIILEFFLDILLLSFILNHDEDYVSSANTFRNTFSKDFTKLIREKSSNLFSSHFHTHDSLLRVEFSHTL